MKTYRVWTDEASVSVHVDDRDNYNLRELEQALRFKSKNIKAKADPEIFKFAADFIMTEILVQEHFQDE